MFFCFCHPKPDAQLIFFINVEYCLDSFSNAILKYEKKKKLLFVFFNFFP
jgi:hypothetical protein